MRGLNTSTWNRIRYTVMAPVYDRVVHLDRARSEAIGRLDLRPAERVLVPGAGTGQDLPFLPGEVEVVAGDIAPGMLRRLRSRARLRDGTTEVRELDAECLDFPDGSFDAVVLHLIVAIVPDPRACVAEAARVLRVGGRISVLDKFAPEGRVPLWRRIVSPLAETVATSVDRQLDVLLEGLPLQLMERRPAALGGLLESALLTKLGGGSQAG